MHRSQVFFWTLIAFAIGVGFGDLYGFSGVAIKLMSVAVGALFFISVLKREALAPAFMAFGLVFGFMRSGSGAIEIMRTISFLTAPLVVMKDAFVMSLERALPYPEVSYLSGLLVGEKSAIPFNIKEAFRITGTSHLVALSGYNVTILATYIAKIFSSLWVTISVIALFTLMTGAESSIVRAAIMGILALLARREGRSYEIRNSLVFAAALMLIFDPSLLLGDLGFQLSFLATVGLVYVSPWIDPYLKWVPKKFGAREAASATLGAQAVTFPLIFIKFGAYSLLSPVVNVLVIIAVPATMFFGFITGIAGLAGRYVALVPAIPTYILLKYQLVIIRFFAGLGS